MEVYDFEGRVDVDCGEDLLHRLRSVRKGKYGAFILSHDSGDGGQPSLWIQINEDIAYLHYLPDSRGLHAGFQAKDMMPGVCEEAVHFLMVTGTEADSFTVPRETLVPVDAAYKAAEEFLHEPALPPSITWFEL
jgi:hypothetical protein